MNTKQRGFTLVELLITLAISGALIAGFGQILLQSKHTYKSQQTLSHMMEDGRYILEVLTKETRRIGFLRNRFASTGGAVGDANTVFVAHPNALNSGIDLVAGASISGAYSEVGFEDGTGNVNPHNINKLVFRYQLNDASELSSSASDYSPCTRNISINPSEDDPTTLIREDLPTETIHVVSIYLYVAYDSTNIPVLYCDAERDIIDATTGTRVLVSASSAEPLVSNVERFLVLYGTDADPPPPGSHNDGAANAYLRADNVANYMRTDGTLTDWTSVVGIRLYIVLRSDETNIARNDPSYRIDGQSITPEGPAEKRLYRVFSTTISSRNN